MFGKKKVIDYENGDHYEGEVNVAGQPHGRGMMSYVSPTGCGRRDTYKGGFRNGKRNGKGHISYELNGYYAEYDGEWRDDLRCGRGKYKRWSSLGRYRYEYNGEWLDDKEHGMGVSVDSSQQGAHLSTVTKKYKGEFKNGKPDGRGIIERDGFDGSFANGKEYIEGVFRNGELEGHGVFTYVNGDKFEGEFVHGSRHGHGKVTCANGVSYEADWDNGDFVFESFKGDASLQVPLLLLCESSHGFDYSKRTTCLIAARKGRQDYSNSLPMGNHSVQSSGFIVIVDVTADSVTYEVKASFDKEGHGFEDTIHRGETKKYEVEHTQYGTMYGDEFEYTTGASLVVVCK